MSSTAASTAGTTGERSRAAGWVEVLARLGYAAKGVVYLSVGLLSAAAALGSAPGSGAGARSSREALATLAGQPFGQVLMLLVAIGLTGYVVWRLVQALLDPEHEGTDAKGLAKRGALLVSAAVYGALGLWVVRSLLGAAGFGGGGGGASGGGSSAQTWSQQLLAQPWGAWLLGAAGVAIFGYGIAEFVKAWRRTYERRLRRDLSGGARKWAGRLARFGLSARGLVFLIVGGFVVYTAVTADPARARGMEGALAAVGEQPYGPWLMGVVALGLAAYGGLQLVKAWYRRIGPVQPV